MREPKPLLDGDATEFERLLLESARRERPSARSLYRMQQHLGFSGPSVWLSGAEAALSTTAGKSALMLLGVAVLLGGRAALEFRSEAANEGDLHRDESANRAPMGPPEGAEENAHAGGLRAEIELLDQVRGAVKRGDSAEARRLLDAYMQRFPDGALRREARVMRNRLTTVR